MATEATEVGVWTMECLPEKVKARFEESAREFADLGSDGMTDKFHTSLAMRKRLVECCEDSTQEECPKPD